MITNREIIMAIIDNDCFDKADAAILLEGDGFFRYKKAVDLYKKNLVSKIVFSGNITNREYGSFPFEELLPYIIDAGVPDECIIHENKSLNTREQAIEIIKLSKYYKWKKLALVASNDHQYRAYLTFLREIIDSKSEIVLYNCPARNLKWFHDSGWGTRIDRLSQEFDKIEKYTNLGHLASFDEVINYQKWKEALSDD